jgi:hypothetical protein
MVEHLRALVEGADRRKSAADNPEVEGGDAQAGDGAGQKGAPPGQQRGQHDPPAEGDGDVGEAAGEEEDGAVARARQGGAADRPRGREDVLPSCHCDRDRRRAAQGRSGGSRRQAVAQVPVRWTASVRNRA